MKINYISPIVIGITVFICTTLFACENEDESSKTSYKFTFPSSDPANGLVVDNAAGTVLWDFTNLTYWGTESPTVVDKTGYTMQNDTLRFITHKETSERPKFRTLDKIYAFGKYTWRVYIPMPGVGDCCSVGAFLYSDDHHEIDFEIGYGKASVRKSLSAGSSDLVAYLTCQDNPAFQRFSLVKANKWYDLTMDLQNVNGKYYLSWIINDKVVASVQTEFGSETPFYIFCSLENLSFIGDHLATQDNYCLFDFVKFQPYNN